MNETAAPPYKPGPTGPTIVTQSQDSASPFHPGECAIQARLGMREKIEAFGRRAIRDHLTEQHRQFFPQLPLFFVGTIDREGRPWASPLAGPPGFLTAPDPKHLHVAARPFAGDPLCETLFDGAPIGGLGIELHTRRRNRVNGRVALDPAGDGFTLSVNQSFGNCAQYIHRRLFRPAPAQSRPGRPVRRAAALDAAACALIARADTFFIASGGGGDPGDLRQGMDVSHRGGPPGFVRMLDERHLAWPDYRGNFFFNTLGNLLLDPHCALLFLDFESGDALQLTGRAEIVWTRPRDDAQFRGAERLVRFEIDLVVHIGASCSSTGLYCEACPVTQNLRQLSNGRGSPQPWISFAIGGTAACWKSRPQCLWSLSSTPFRVAVWHKPRSDALAL